MAKNLRNFFLPHPHTHTHTHVAKFHSKLNFNGIAKNLRRLFLNYEGILNDSAKNSIMKKITFDFKNRGGGGGRRKSQMRDH